MVINTPKAIACNYLGGWFTIDFISVFPFYLFIPTGVMTKLFRLARLPRLLKLLDVNRFNKVLQSFSQDSNIDDILHLSYIQFLYAMIRLILMALIITYFLGCINFFISDTFNSETDVQSRSTFLTFHGIVEYQASLDWDKILANKIVDITNDGRRVLRDDKVEPQAYNEGSMMVISCYFALTTLSTVGYGDLYPVSPLEMLVTVVI